MQRSPNDIHPANLNGVKEPKTWNRTTILEDWRETYGASPPKHLSINFMQKAISYERQSAAEGRVPKRILRHIKAMAGGSAQANNVGSRLKAGAHLMREWNGRTYQIEVVENGFVMDGKTYRSLSAIAKNITGTHWSGPRFFGLRS